MSASVTAKGALSPPESARLAELEPIIERGMGTFKSVGDALAEISDRRLYRATHDSFKQYVQDKYEMCVSRAYQLIEGAEVIKLLPPEMSTIVDTENKARELAKVAPKKRAKVLEVAASNGRVTAKAIKQAAEAENAQVVTNVEAIKPESSTPPTEESKRQEEEWARRDAELLALVEDFYRQVSSRFSPDEVRYAGGLFNSMIQKAEVAALPKTEAA
jgi:hypothetical protein